MRSRVVANHGKLNNKERNKESTARGGMTKMVRLFRTKKLKLELLNVCACFKASWQGRPESVRREDRRFQKQGGIGTG